MEPADLEEIKLGMLIGYLFMAVIFYFASSYLKKHPPRHINPLYGYRSRKAMKSDKHWNFAQKDSVNRMRHVSAFYLLCAAVRYAIPQASPLWDLIAFLTLVVAVCLYLFLGTELELMRLDDGDAQ